MRNATLSMAVAAFAWSSAAEAQTMTADALRVLLSGNTMSGVTTNGAPFDVYFAADGTVQLHVRTSQPFRDSGTWSVNDQGQYCTQYKVLRSGHLSCFGVEQRSPEDVVVKDSGGAPAQAKIKKGNAAGL